MDEILYIERASGTKIVSLIQVDCHPHMRLTSVLRKILHIPKWGRLSPLIQQNLDTGSVQKLLRLLSGSLVALGLAGGCWLYKLFWDGDQWIGF